MINKAVLAAFLILCLAAATGCNTLHGIGRDVESLGQALSNTADKR